MGKFQYVGKRIPRIDAFDKVTGKAKYATDHYFEGMLWGKVLRSKLPHARIRKIDTSRAKDHPGVEAVLTYDDIPGEKGFGIIENNWPVLCKDRVRYQGDALALVAASDEASALEALSLIDVEYDPLPTINSPRDALCQDAIELYESGNILKTLTLSIGEADKAFAEADIITEGVYHTQCVEHAYLETEGGVALFNEPEGGLTVWCSNQYSFRDQQAIARALLIDPEKIRVIGTPTGGSFGGKDDITAQIHLALLAYYTKKPVFLHWTREESIISGTKRHPMQVSFRIGAKRNGELLANRVSIVADAGPYDSLSVPVLGLAFETSPGPYRYKSTSISAKAVYTNNAVGGAFRGFGSPQVLFGIEQEMDKIAEKLGMDPVDFRLVNAVQQGDKSALGHVLRTSTGIKETLEAAKRTALWAKREELKIKYGEKSRTKRYGIGLAAIWQAVGMGANIPDYGEVIIELVEKGKVLLRTGSIEYGQGNTTAFVQILAEYLQCDINRISVLSGDTANTPDTGPVSASRSVMINGNAIIDAVDKLLPQIKAIAALELNVKEVYLDYKDEQVFCIKDTAKRMYLDEIAEAAFRRKIQLKAKGRSDMAEPKEKYGDGFPHNYYAYGTQIAFVGVDEETGKVDVEKLMIIPEFGRAINITGAEAQCEGGGVMGQGFALFEEVVIKNGEFQNTGFSTYILPTSLDAPEQDVLIVEKKEKSGPFGAKGVAEIVTDSVAPAIANAIYDAVGVRISSLPITPEKIVCALEESKAQSEKERTL